ncbi:MULTISPECIES: TetR/AcrR family transcriptional regulator [Acinetobacter]|jgi:AcrR family transcriptional regulator|uniref:Division inhibitor protein n=3 Tax=Acinetobacter TaxID=469 RepID=A0A1R7QDX3_ACIJO|nr:MULTISPECIES: TetR/AcrR family transcriptional regulator [Acinetobacter]MDA0777168.1 TetR/AcrR family transcriptional regulator [Pseudomonadota bacterium]NWK50113.1 TetR/AcrR family transcriptional regulator [Acinetobacter sp. SwsAc7]NWK63048.1 TetR/AcrR family transcriptional regulator [Acinetobacter sp. SwsAc3]OFW90441.1 MAG: TetR family transcriptional regulator [Acinetobacter sp. RIFCSPHIGHO2_12_41_5]OHC20437.1 MAG: TetR family transcriptional regulator [Pseudomonadales bacterium RIFCSP
MTSVRQQNFLLRKEKILAMAETLLLDNNQDITLSELATELDIAKGTIYKHFKSKNQLYLELIILNETRLLEISQKHNNDIKTYVSEYMLYNMLNSNRTILLHVIEERLTNNERKLKELFEKLYQIREQRIIEIKDMTSDYLKSLDSAMSIRDYLSYVWTVTYGASLLLNSTHYQKSIGSRERLIKLYVNQALMTPDKISHAAL